MIKLISKNFKRIIFSIEQIIFALMCLLTLVFLFIVFIVKDNLFDSYDLKKREIKKEDMDKMNNKTTVNSNNEEPMFI